MACKVDKIKLPKQYDQRIKLSDEQRDEIRKKYETGLYSTYQLADEYHVSRRLVSFILNPEKYELAKEQYRERRKDGRYTPDKDKRNAIQKKHRNYKRTLYDAGKIK